MQRDGRRTDGVTGHMGWTMGGVEWADRCEEGSFSPLRVEYGKRRTLDNTNRLKIQPLWNQCKEAASFTPGRPLFIDKIHRICINLRHAFPGKRGVDISIFVHSMTTGPQVLKQNRKTVSK